MSLCVNKILLFKVEIQETNWLSRNPCLFGDSEKQKVDKMILVKFLFVKVNHIVSTKQSMKTKQMVGAKCRLELGCLKKHCELFLRAKEKK